MFLKAYLKKQIFQGFCSVFLGKRHRKTHVDNVLKKKLINRFFDGVKYPSCKIDVKAAATAAPSWYLGIFVRLGFSYVVNFFCGSE
jgi:hypothetical protein